MKIGNLHIRRIDNSNIVVHKDLGFLKDGNLRMNEPVTYHGTIEAALKSARRRLQRESLTSATECDEVIDKFKQVDKMFLKALKAQNEELHELMEKLYA